MVITLIVSFVSKSKGRGKSRSPRNTDYSPSLWKMEMLFQRFSITVRIQDLQG